MDGPEYQGVGDVICCIWGVGAGGEEERKDSNTGDTCMRQPLHPPRKRRREVISSVLVRCCMVRGGKLSICLLSKDIAGGLVQDAAYGDGVEFRGQALSIRKWGSPFFFQDNLVQESGQSGA